MALRGKKPEDRKQRLKLLMSGPPGVGKTTAAAQMPNPYIIDTEQGSTHYGDLIEKSGGVVFESTDIDDITREVRSLLSEKHNFLTLVIDPITTIYENAVEEGEKKVGSDWGRHYGWANTKMKRLTNLVVALDMNVVFTAHEKDDYDTVTNAKGEKERVNVGKTYDGYKKLDYMFDLYVKLRRQDKNEAGSPRIATVAKTRLEQFPDLSEFEWSYQSICDRYGREKLEKGVEVIDLANVEQIERFKFLMSTLTEDEVKSLKLHKMDMDDLVDLPAERLAKGIELIENHKAAKIAE